MSLVPDSLTAKRVSRQDLADLNADLVGRWEAVFGILLSLVINTTLSTEGVDVLSLDEMTAVLSREQEETCHSFTPSSRYGDGACREDSCKPFSRRRSVTTKR